MDIRPCQERDLEALERHMPSPGRTRRHARRYARQRQGLSTFLVAWSEAVPVGTAEILWQGSASPDVRARFPGCPELDGLGVRPAHLRSHSIGTAIIRAAEDRVRDRGHHWIGPGVDDDRAAALHLGLGYRVTGCRYLDRYHYLDDDGARHDVADPCRFLVKRPAGPERAGPAGRERT